MKDNPKSARVEVRFTNSEKQRLQRCAEKAGLRLSQYIRLCCEANTAKGAAPTELWSLLEELYQLYDELPPERQRRLEQLILALQETV